MDASTRPAQVVSASRPPVRHEIVASRDLEKVHYDIRGPVLEEAHRMAADGLSITKLNIGNPALFGFKAPPPLLHDMTQHLVEAEAYCDSLGLESARHAIVRYANGRGIHGIDIDDVYTGNGVSELIVMALQALLSRGDEILIPSPDYPLWTAAANLAGATPVHYRCDELADWFPDIDDIRRKVTRRTKAIVIINPNNPTGAVYSPELLEAIVDVARENDLVVLSDEIYDRILYDDAVHHSIAAMTDDVLFVTMSGLSKSSLAAGFRSGWMIVSGAKDRAGSYLEALRLLASMRLCANVPAQYAIERSLTDTQVIDDLVKPSGRLYEQRRLACRLLNDIDGVSCAPAMGALYLFPKIDADRFGIVDDRQFVLDLLKAERILMVQGSGFHWPKPDHFRIVFLPTVEELTDSIGRIGQFLTDYRQTA